MLSPALGLLLFLFSGAAGATAEPDGPAFRVIQTRNAETLRRDLRSSTDAGYRVLAASPGSTLDGKPMVLLLLQRDSPASRPREYEVLVPSGNFDDEASLDQLRALGMQGYRLTSGGIVAHRVEEFWLPERAYDSQLTLILERSTSPGTFVYDAVRFDEFETFQHELGERREEGYEVLSLINSARRLRALLARPLDEQALDRRRREYRLLLNATNHSLTRGLKRAGARGYRPIAAADASIHAPTMVLLEQADPATPKARTYRVLRDPVVKQRKGRLERKLNRFGAEGYRVVPRSSTDRALILEREIGGPQDARGYRTVASRQTPGISSALQAAMRDGYHFVRMIADGDAIIVLLEKRPAES